MTNQTKAAAVPAGNPQPIAWCSSKGFEEAQADCQSFCGWREPYNDCDMALYAGPVSPTPARIHNCPTHGQQGPEAWGCPECVRELRKELATAREAVRRLVDWGGSCVSLGLSSEVILSVADWAANGMTGPLPPLPPHIASRDHGSTPVPAEKAYAALQASRFTTTKP